MMIDSKSAAQIKEDLLVHVKTLDALLKTVDEFNN
jgi:hypothetical protein